MLPGEVPNGHVRSIVLLGGYIYPVGESVVHDPTVDFTAIAVDMDPSRPILVTVIIAIAAVVCLVLVALVVALLYVQRKKRRRMQVPPPYR
jgi:ABC-type Fe3+ transport system permease subunit